MATNPGGDSNRLGKHNIIVLGDHDTGEHVDTLGKQADKHGAAIAEVHTFAQGEPASNGSLAEVDAVVTAVSRAISTGADIWVPYPMPDLGQEQHIRRLSLVLQRHGVNLRVGPHLWPCPTTGGMNEADLALRREVQSVDELDHAALAAGGFQTLGAEIEAALASTRIRPAGLPIQQPPNDPSRIEQRDGCNPTLPATTAPWPQRQPALKQYAEWLVASCGLTQAEAADLINASGHRTPRGRMWQQSTVSGLINGRYDRPAAA